MTLRYRSDETIATAVLSLDELLFSTTVTNGFARLGHTLRECCLADNNSLPQVLDQFISGNQAITVTDQVREEIKDFGLNLQHVSGAAKLAALIVECELIEEVNHGLTPDTYRSFFLKKRDAPSYSNCSKSGRSHGSMPSLV